MKIALALIIVNQALNPLIRCKQGGANVLGMHIDEGANVQLCQSVRRQMSLHAIIGQGANVQGGTCPTLN